jgi:hypothetical protein
VIDLDQPACDRRKSYSSSITESFDRFERKQGSELAVSRKLGGIFMLRRVVFLTLAIGLLLVSTAAWSDPARSRNIEVLWGGSFYAAEIITVRGDRYRVHYTDWGTEWDEWVERDRMRAVPHRPPLERAQVGQKLEARWHGTWWAAEVVAAKNGFFKIHYTGWGSEWDEWVELDRLRLPS